MNTRYAVKSSLGAAITALQLLLTKSPPVVLIRRFCWDASFSPAADCSGFSYVLNLTKSVLVKCQNLPKTVLYSHKNLTFLCRIFGECARNVVQQLTRAYRTMTPWPTPGAHRPMQTQSKPHLKPLKIPPLSDVLAPGSIDIPPRKRCP